MSKDASGSGQLVNVPYSATLGQLAEGNRARIQDSLFHQPIDTPIDVSEKMTATKHGKQRPNDSSQIFAAHTSGSDAVLKRLTPGEGEPFSSQIVEAQSNNESLVLSVAGEVKSSHGGQITDIAISSKQQQSSDSSQIVAGLGSDICLERLVHGEAGTSSRGICQIESVESTTKCKQAVTSELNKLNTVAKAPGDKTTKHRKRESSESFCIDAPQQLNTTAKQIILDVSPQENICKISIPGGVSVDVGIVARPSNDVFQRANTEILQLMEHDSFARWKSEHHRKAA